MQLINGYYIYCARKGNVYIARQLTAEEITLWLKMVSLFFGLIHIYLGRTVIFERIGRRGGERKRSAV